LRRSSWTTWQSSLRDYEHRAAVADFVRRVREELAPLALLLFGSLAKGEYHTFSDADVCVILSASEVHPFDGYDRVAALDPTGIVQPVVYGRDQFKRMIGEGNGLALEVMHHGIALAGDEGFLTELETAWERAQDRLGLQKTPTGWRITQLKEVS